MPVWRVTQISVHGYARHSPIDHGPTRELYRRTVALTQWKAVWITDRPVSLVRYLMYSYWICTLIDTKPHDYKEKDCLDTASSDWGLAAASVSIVDMHELEHEAHPNPASQLQQLCTHASMRNWHVRQRPRASGDTASWTRPTRSKENCSYHNVCVSSLLWHDLWSIKKIL